MYTRSEFVNIAICQHLISLNLSFDQIMWLVKWPLDPLDKFCLQSEVSSPRPHPSTVDALCMLYFLSDLVGCQNGLQLVLVLLPGGQFVISLPVHGWHPIILRGISAKDGPKMTRGS